MSDPRTGKPISVSIDGTALPYIMIPVSQLGRLRSLFDQHRIEYWVESDAISVEDEPPVAFVNLGRSGDASAAQSILDSAS